MFHNVSLCCSGKTDSYLGEKKRKFYIRLMLVGTCWYWLEKGDLEKLISKLLARATWTWLLGVCRLLVYTVTISLNSNSH